MGRIALFMEMAGKRCLVVVVGGGADADMMERMLWMRAEEMAAGTESAPK